MVERCDGAHAERGGEEDARAEVGRVAQDGVLDGAAGRELGAL